jgi:hypothetical protein
MNISNHAYIRAQQRGISIPFIELVQEFGDVKDAGGGSIVRYFGRKGKGRLKKSVGEDYLKKNSESLKTYIIECRDSGTVVTTGKLFSKSRVSHFSSRCKTKSDFYRRSSDKRKQAIAIARVSS